MGTVAFHFFRPASERFDPTAQRAQIVIKQSFSLHLEPVPKVDLHPVLRYQSCEMLERSIKGSLCIVREAACWKFPAPEVVAQTLTTDAFTRTGFVTAIATIQIFFFFTLHNRFSPYRARKDPTCPNRPGTLMVFIFIKKDFSLFRQKISMFSLKGPQSRHISIFSSNFPWISSRQWVPETSQHLSSLDW